MMIAENSLSFSTNTQSSDAALLMMMMMTSTVRSHVCFTSFSSEFYVSQSIISNKEWSCAHRQCMIYKFISTTWPWPHIRPPFNDLCDGWTCMRLPIGKHETETNVLINMFLYARLHVDGLWHNLRMASVCDISEWHRRDKVCGNDVRA